MEDPRQHCRPAGNRRHFKPTLCQNLSEIAIFYLPGLYFMASRYSGGTKQDGGKNGKRKYGHTH
jgi:hypothetical protein